MGKTPRTFPMTGAGLILGRKGVGFFWSCGDHPCTFFAWGGRPARIPGKRVSRRARRWVRIRFAAAQ